jgi:hypothetical protein
MSVLAEDTIFVRGGTVGGSNEYGGIDESGGAGTATAIEGSGGSVSVNSDGSVNLSVPEPPKPKIIPLIIGYFGLKYLGVL